MPSDAKMFSTETILSAVVVPELAPWLLPIPSFDWLSRKAPATAAAPSTPAMMNPLLDTPVLPLLAKGTGMDSMGASTGLGTILVGAVLVCSEHLLACDLPAVAVDPYELSLLPTGELPKTLPTVAPVVSPQLVSDDVTVEAPCGIVAVAAACVGADATEGVPPASRASRSATMSSAER